MTPERFQEVSRIYQQAAELAAAERPPYLVAACAGDDTLRAEVEALLRYEDASAFLDQPALKLTTQILNGDPPLSLAGRQVGHCQLRSLLGKGGMGEIWLAEDTQLGRRVAVKILPEEFTADAARVRRFTQEARAASALNHPNILTIHDIGTFAAEAATTHYIVTEFIDGETLRERMRQTPNAQMPAAVVVELAVQIAAALAAAHEAGIMHRDIKPENVMVRKDGLVKVLDFGLAKLTERKTPVADAEAPTQPLLSTDTGMVMGTPRYMSPEQARGEKLDARTDIFSLGVMFYEMVEGRPPFVGATTSEMIAAILRDEPPPLTLDAPPELARIIGQALRKDRDERYQTAKALLGDLNQLKEQLLVEKFVVPPAGGNLRGRTLPPAGGATNKRRRAAFIALAGIITILALTLAGIGYYTRLKPSPRIESLAVLPFVNVGANPDAEYLSDGITDGLINGLSRLPELKVMSRNSVFRYKGKETDAQEVGNTLGVRAVLTGQVTQHGDDLLISLALVDVRDNSHLWGEQYSYKLSNLLPVQTELARDVAQQLRLKLGRVEQQQLAQRGTENAEAYDLYLRGRYELNTLASNQQTSFNYFQQAVEKDPRFASAWAGLAQAYVAKAGLGATLRLAPKEAYPLAKAAAEKAVGLDDTLAEAHVSLALIAFHYEWDWPKVEREFQRAIALKPDDVPARHWYSHYLIALGRFDESLAESQRILALDPLNVAMPYHLGFHYWNARQYEEAIVPLQKALAEKPNFSHARSILGMVYVQQGRYQEAIEEMQKVRTMGDNDNRGLLGYAYAVAGRRAEAREVLKQLQEEAKNKTKIVSSCNVARILAGLDEKEQAFAWLDKAIAERDSNLTLPGLKVDMHMDGLRSDPRFADLLRRMGLTQ